MIRIRWQDETLEVHRLIFRAGHEASFDSILNAIAQQNGLDVADERAEPRPGDFWLGVHPRAGWGDADPALIGWASVIEVPLAVRVFQSVSDQNARRVADSFRRRALATGLDHPLLISNVA